MNNFNLLTEPWLKIQNDEGVQNQSILDLVINKEKNKCVSFCRVEFDYASLQFLISVFQFLLAPETIQDLKAYFNTPPIEKIKQNLDIYKSSFYLLGDKPFMQDIKLNTKLDLQDNPLENLSISSFIIGGASESKLNLNQSLIFSPLNQIKCICSSCASLSIMSRTWIGAGGGEGYRHGLSGEGPLINILKSSESLWKTILLNIIPLNTLENKTIGTKSRNNDINNFPWLGELDYSYPDDQKITKQVKKELKANGGEIEVDPSKKGIFYNFWAGGQRLLLNSEKELEKCDICNDMGIVFKSYKKYQNGPKHDKSLFFHPLVPKILIDIKKSSDQTDESFSLMEKNKLIPENIKYSKYFYSHWTTLLYWNKKTVNGEISLNIQNYLKNLSQKHEAKISLNGAFLIQSIPQNFLNKTFPLFEMQDFSETDETFLINYLEQMVEQANRTFNILKKYTYLSLMSKDLTSDSHFYKNMKNNGYYQEIFNGWWKHSEPCFFEYVEKIWTSIKHQKDGVIIKEFIASYKKDINNFTYNFLEKYSDKSFNKIIFYKQLQKMKIELFKEKNVK